MALRLVFYCIMIFSLCPAILLNFQSLCYLRPRAIGITNLA